MNCKLCGSEYLKSDNYCIKCGHLVKMTGFRKMKLWVGISIARVRASWEMVKQARRFCS